MELEFLKSASVIVKENNKTLLVDPWLVDGEYYGAWYHYPKFNFKNFLKRKIDYIYLSHIHPDHMSRETLKKLDKKITILIHKYAKPFLKFNLEKLGFKNIIELKHGEKFNLEKNFYIQIYAADDCNPSLCQKFFKCHFSAEKLGSQQIDTISLVSNGRKNILNVNDCPLELSAGVTDKIMKDVKQVDLLLTGYSGAGPFPQCFPHYSKEKKINLMKNKKEKFINQAYNYINTVKPKYYMPFAGTFFLGSNLYNLNEFRGVPTRYEAINSLNKKIKKSKNIKPLLLKTHGKFNLENYKVLNPLKKEEVKYDSKMKNYLKSKKLSYHFMKKPKKSEILRLMHIASKNFFEKIKLR